MILETHMKGNDSLHRVFGMRGMRNAPLVPLAAKRPRPEFLDFHQENVFRG